MTDREIKEQRAKLEKLRHDIHEEWKMYDARYPVEVGAYKPPDYDRGQLEFVERLQDVSKQISALPSTKAAKFRRVLVIVVVLAGLAWLVLRVIF